MNDYHGAETIKMSGIVGNPLFLESPGWEALRGFKVDGGSTLNPAALLSYLWLRSACGGGIDFARKIRACCQHNGGHDCGVRRSIHLALLLRAP